MRACRPARVAEVISGPSSVCCSSSHTSSAFCACSRFSASSHTALCGPSMTSSVISWPRCAGRQCSTTASGSARPSSSALTWNGRNGRDPVQPVVLLAHRRPGVGDQHVGAVGGRRGIGGERHRGAGRCGALLGGGHELRVRFEAGGRGDGDVDARRDPAEHQRVRHVVGAVAEVGQPQPLQRALALGERLQVGQHLARVELVGQRVDDRHASPRTAIAVEPLLAERAPHDRVDVAGQHLSGVLQRLLAAELGAAAVDDDGVAAELRDADLEREPGAGGVLVEDDRDTARPVERAAAERVLLQLGGQRQHLGLLVGRQVVVAQEVPRCHRRPTRPCRARRAAR